MQIKDILPLEYYLSEDVVSLSKHLLGKVVVTNSQGKTTAGIIVETEAYRAPEDKGSHAFSGRRTPRNESMFHTGGCAYVYISYGIHPMLNVVTAPKDVPHAILIRAIEPIEGLEIMMTRRGINKTDFRLTNGPGKLAVALGIDKSFDGRLLTDKSIRIFETDSVISENLIVSGSRVGFSKHTGEAAHYPWRFYIKGNPWVSQPLKVDYTEKW